MLLILVLVALAGLTAASDDCSFASSKFTIEPLTGTLGWSNRGY
jgi:hypothetical protein